MTKPRVAVGGLLHETHSFMETPTTLSDFQATSLHCGADLLDALGGTRSGIGGMIDAEREWTLIPTVYAAAMPSGIVTNDAYETLTDNLIDRLRAAFPLDGVALTLHGAMVTESLLDAETDLLERVRAVIGPTPLAVELDMHGNVSPRLIELADVVVAYDTNPHIDTYERGVEAARLLDRLMRGDIRPVAAHRAPRVILPAQATGTSDSPLLHVHARAAEIKRDPAVLSICVMGGFAYAHTPLTGASVIVTTDDRPELAVRYADELSAILRQHRHDGLLPLFSPAEAVRKANTFGGNGPVILVDSADNIGGGTPGDGTDALAALLDARVEEVTVVLADAEAVDVCRQAGIGAEVTLTVGGKTDRWHGAPLIVTGIVRALSDGVVPCEQSDNHFAAFNGGVLRMGRTAWLRVGGINLILNECKTPPGDLAQLRGIGVIPERQRMIVVKSAVAYRAAYLPIASGVVEMDTAGGCTAPT